MQTTWRTTSSQREAETELSPAWTCPVLYLKALFSVSFLATRLNFARNYRAHTATEVRGLVWSADGPEWQLWFSTFKRLLPGLSDNHRGIISIFSWHRLFSWVSRGFSRVQFFPDHCICWNSQSGGSMSIVVILAWLQATWVQIVMLLPVWSWAPHLALWNLSFLMCK